MSWAAIASTGLTNCVGSTTTIQQTAQSAPSEASFAQPQAPETSSWARITRGNDSAALAPEPPEAAPQRTGWVNVEVTFRPDRGLNQPAGCEWYDRLVLPVHLEWRSNKLVNVLENAIKRQMCDQLQRQNAPRHEYDRISALHVWGVRALDSGVRVRRGHPHVQLCDREQGHKVDLIWEEFVKRLPAEKRATQKGEVAFTLYLAYDWGVSVHRDMRGKPRALV